MAEIPIKGPEESDEMRIKNETKTAPETQITDKLDLTEIGEVLNAPDLLEQVASFQKMSAEEQELLAIKRGLIMTKQELQSRLAEEMDKKKITIDELKSEIPGLQNECKQLGQLLGVDIFK